MICNSTNYYNDQTRISYQPVTDNNSQLNGQTFVHKLTQRYDKVFYKIFTRNRTLIGCLPHIVFEKVFKYSTNASGSKVSMVSIP